MTGSGQSNRDQSSIQISERQVERLFEQIPITAYKKHTAREWTWTLAHCLWIRLELCEPGVQPLWYLELPR